jgi:thymidylate kinase
VNEQDRLDSMRIFLRTDIRHDLRILPRPFIVEVGGTPSSGKTSGVNESDRYFRQMGFSVWHPPEGAEMVRDISRATPRYNLATALYALGNLAHQSERHEHDIYILERGPFDAYVWMMYWREKGKVSDAQMRAAQEFYLLPFFTGEIDLALYMTCEPDEAMRREKRVSLSNVAGGTTNPATIRTLVDRYRTAYGELMPLYPQLEILDTTKMSEWETITTVKDLIMTAFERRISHAP